MSVFRDGSGQEKDSTGTRVGWRDLERIVSELFHGKALEAKGVFDVIVPSTESPGVVYGISVKSKCLGSNAVIQRLDVSGRVYMELSNSPAKLWAPLKSEGIGENAFGDDNYAQAIGDSILKTVHGWYSETGLPQIDLRRSVYLVVSYSKPKATEERLYQVHSFELGFPQGIKWSFRSTKCLRGFDPNYPGEILFDWYGLSGGQLKYYPRAATALFDSPVFSLLSPKVLSITQRSKVYWPDEWSGFEE